MTRRERLLAKIEKRRAWAQGAKAESERRFDTAHHALDGIPPGQPILVGHHSERRHRGALDRHDRNMRAAFEASDRATNHVSKAAGLEDQLDRAIFDDDPDAVEQLQAKIERLEAERERRKAVNRAYKRGDAAALAELGLDLEQLRARMPHYERVPYPPYSLSNLGATIRTAAKRIELIARRKAQTERAEAAGGTLVEVHAGAYGTQVQVTFDEYPGRPMIEALKAAGYHWSRPSWYGALDKLPESLREHLPAPPAPAEGGAA